MYDPMVHVYLYVTYTYKWLFCDKNKYPIPFFFAREFQVTMGAYSGEYSICFPPFVAKHTFVSWSGAVSSNERLMHI